MVFEDNSKYLAEAIQMEIYNHNENARTAYPARVVGVNSRFSVTVEISNPRMADDGTNMDNTQILNVPIAYPKSGTSIIFFPVKVGDVGHCVVMDNNIDNFKISTNSAAVQAYDNRMKDVMDSVFVPGLAPFAVSQKQMNSLTLGSDPNDLLIVHNVGTGQETQLALKTDGNAEIKSQFTVKVIGKDIELNASNSITLNAQQMNVNVSQTNWTGQGYVVGDWTVNGIPFSTHKHTGVTPGTGTSGLPTA
ncbi:Gp138 family membrane-puncturing spike protein [Pseudomonas sp. NY11226]|uniref:Gp138 family membrane-puncturing spike protein n=1 Tax=Pseudomonas sp. NY11226 TaxID=3400362 RepID=UPI003A88E2A1